MSNVKIKKLSHVLKGRVRYFGSGLESFRRVVFSFINQVILSAQKAAVRYFNRIHVYPKRKKLRLQNQTIVSLLNLNYCCFNKHKLTKSEGLRRDYRIRCRAGNMHGILHMRTSHKLLVTGETRKYFSTLLGELKNGSASRLKNIETLEFNSDWFKNDNTLFERAVSVNALKKAWSTINNKLIKEKNFSLDKIVDSWFITTSKKLVEGSFKYPNQKKTTIEKNSKNITRTKIIEKALLNALEPLFEGYSKWETISKEEYDLKSLTFLDELNYRKIKLLNETVYQKKIVVNKVVFTPHNYSFRPQKSAHQALNEIKHWRKNTIFFIECNISKKFDKINLKRLKNIFNEQVCDIRFWMEISKILNSGTILELEGLFNQKKVVQENILSPFLFNVYLHKFDQKVISLQKKTMYTNKSHESSIYGNKKAELTYRNLSKEFAATNLKKALTRYGSKENLLKAQKTAYKEYHKNYGRHKNSDLKIRHIQYIRYANDFLIGIVGNREYATQIRNDLNTFLKSNLHLDVEKNNLVHQNKNALTFLGHKIKLTEFKSKPSSRPKQIRASKKNKNKSISRFLELDKRLAKAKSRQLYLNVLSKFNLVSEKLKMSLKSKKHTDLLSLFFAYRNVGSIIMEKLLLTNWNQFSELLTLVDNPNYLLTKPRNPAINRWISYLTVEVRQLNELNATILRDKLNSLIKYKFLNEMSKGQADKIKKLQFSYLNDINCIINKPLNNVSIEQKHEKLNVNKNISSTLNNKIITKNDNSSSNKSISIKAPISETFAKLRLKGYVHPIKDKAIGNSKLEFYTDLEIVLHFNLIINKLLNWFSGADNFCKIKGLAQMLRKSCVLTLANKHKKNQNWVYTVYGSEITINEGKNKTLLITKSRILNYPNKFNLKPE